MTAVVDTSSLNYLVLLELTSLLPRVFDRVVAPAAVVRELQAEAAPLAVAEFARDPPLWLDCQSFVLQPPSASEPGLHSGEREVIAGALQLSGSIAVLDDLAARRFALSVGLQITGTVGILVRAAEEGWLDLEKALRALDAAGFHMSAGLRRAVLDKLR